MDEDAQAQRYSAKLPLAVGLTCAVVLVGGLAVWSLTAKIAGAVIASGELTIAAGNQPIEHVDGGAVAEVYVRDGDRVARGDPLVRFADAGLRDHLAALELAHHALVAQRNRLEAEHGGSHSIRWDPALAAAAAVDPAVGALLDQNQAVFDQRLGNHHRQIAILGESAAAARTFAAGQDEGGGRDADQRMAETDAQILRLQASRSSEAEALLLAAQPEEHSLGERIRQLAARIERTTLRAPTAGAVFGLAVTGPGDVVFRGEPLLQIVPDVSALIVRARIRPIDIDQVFVSQEAAIRFAAFPYRSSPERTGTVLRISADALSDSQTGESWYEADLAVEPLPDGAESYEALPLVPGMPVDVQISTGSRTVMSYLVKPVTDFFSRSLREE